MIAGNGGQLIGHILFVNPLLNPGSVDYLDYYISDQNYLSFSTKNGAFVNAYIEEF